MTFDQYKQAVSREMLTVAAKLRGIDTALFEQDEEWDLLYAIEYAAASSPKTQRRTNVT